MKIGIDARMYRSSVAGIGRYSQNLIKNLLEIDKENQYVLFMTPEDAREAKSLILHFSNLRTIIIDIPHFSIAEQTKLPGIIAGEKIDLMHFLNFNYPVSYRGKFIVTIHDLTLHYFPDVARKTNLFKKRAFEYVMKKACQNAAKVIAVSESTKKDIEKVFKISPEKIKVIYEAVDKENSKFQTPNSKQIPNHKFQILKKYSIKTPVILYVGQFRPHKNLPSLVAAFNQVRQEAACKLVMLGKIDPQYQSLKRAIDKSRFKDDILMPGFVSDEELAVWYKQASCFVFPSFYEGFGLPGLEAMAAGLPVIAAKTSSLPEIYQDAAIYFDPFNPQDIADKIKMVLIDGKLRERLIKRGYQVCQKYSWEKTATQTLELYKEC